MIDERRRSQTGARAIRPRDVPSMPAHEIFEGAGEVRLRRTGRHCPSTTFGHFPRISAGDQGKFFSGLALPVTAMVATPPGDRIARDRER